MLAALGIPAGEETAERIAAYHDRIMDMNASINLTGIKDREESLIKNVYDSLTVYDPACFPEGGRALDLGTGAGFPGMILAILRPDMQFVLMDSIQKKLRCVEEAAASVGVKNVKCLHMRAEEGGTPEEAPGDLRCGHRPGGKIPSRGGRMEPALREGGRRVPCHEGAGGR